MVIGVDPNVFARVGSDHTKRSKELAYFLRHEMKSENIIHFIKYFKLL